MNNFSNTRAEHDLSPDERKRRDGQRRGKISRFRVVYGVKALLRKPWKLTFVAMLGISFLKNSPLDMRLGGEEIAGGVSAQKILNDYEEEKIFNIIRDYGEERYAKNIARKVAEVRKRKRIESTKELVDIIAEAVPGKYKHGRIHFATRTFQALRIAVNAELVNLEKVLPRILDEMPVGGRIGIISFHSLEDRIVKRFFAQESRDCICGPDVPVCICGHKQRLEIVTKKPVRPTPEEIEKNPRSRSAKLRVAKKIA